MSTLCSSPFRHVVAQDFQLFAEDRVGSIEKARCRLTRQPRQDHFHLTPACYQSLPGSEERSHRESPWQNLEIDRVEHSDVRFDLGQCVSGGRLRPFLGPTAFHACVHNDHALRDQQVYALGLRSRSIRSILGMLLPIECMVAPLDDKNCEDGRDAADSLYPRRQVLGHGPWGADNSRQCTTPRHTKCGDHPVPCVHREDSARSIFLGQLLSALKRCIAAAPNRQLQMDAEP